MAARARYFRIQALKRSMTAAWLSSQYLASICRPFLMLSGWRRAVLGDLGLHVVERLGLRQAGREVFGQRRHPLADRRRT